MSFTCRHPNARTAGCEVSGFTKGQWQRHRLICEGIPPAAAVHPPAAMDLPPIAAPVIMDVHIEHGSDYEDDALPVASAEPVLAAPAPEPLRADPVLDSFLTRFAECGMRRHIPAAHMDEQYHLIAELLQQLGVVGQRQLLPIVPAKSFPKTSRTAVQRVVKDIAKDIVYYAQCPNTECGKHFLLKPTANAQSGIGKLQKGQRCDRQLNDITESPFDVDPPPVDEKVPCCRTLLTKTVDSDVPQLIYSYISLRSSLQRLLSRPGLAVECELWRSEYTNTNKRTKEKVLAGIHNGSEWERCQNGVRPGGWKARQEHLQAIADLRSAEAALALADIALGAFWVDVSERDRTREEGDETDSAMRDAEHPEEAHADATTRVKRAADRVGKTQELLRRFQIEAQALQEEDTLDAVDHPLLADAGTLALALNVDWFQPFVHGAYSMGAVYMTVLNLPREKRYLTENMILVGVLPGPSETSRTQLHGSLKPLVEELLELYDGVQFNDEAGRHETKIRRAFLFNVVCDLPAARSLCGFARETSRWGCPYCAKQFPKRLSGGSHRDWRPYERLHIDGCPSELVNIRKELPLNELLHPRRKLQAHLEHAREWASAQSAQVPTPQTMTAAKKTCKATVDASNPAADADPTGIRAAWSKAMEKAEQIAFQAHGVRWSVLNNLPYFDSIRSMPIDVMHNILLGTCKHIMALFTNKQSRKRAKGAPRLNPRVAEAAGVFDLADEESADEDDDDLATNAAAEEEKEEELLEAESSAEEEEEEEKVEDPSNKKRRKAAIRAVRAQKKPRQDAAAGAKAAARVQRIADAKAAALRAKHIADQATTQAKAAQLAAVGPNPPSAILVPEDLQALQSILDAASCPRDIGRISKRFASLSNIKAIEWLNWFSIFAVPSVRELMRRGHKRLNLDHLAVFILMQRIVTTLRGYTISVAQIDEVHTDLFEVMRLMAKLFPHRDGSVSPNMHLSLHLKEMLLMFGPAAGWWCFGYEQFNGHLSKLPKSKSCPATSTALRALRWIALAQRVADEQIRSTTVRYTLNIEEFMALQHARAPDQSRRTVPLGDESFPGELRHSRGAPRVLPLRGVDASHSASLHTMDHVRQCLEVHYLETRLADVVQHVRTNWAAMAGETVFVSKSKNATVAVLTTLFANTSSQDTRNQALSCPYVQAWFATFTPTVTLFDTLVLAGETYGSKNSKASNSYVSVSMYEKLGLWRVWHGQVSFYFRHTYKGREHNFAAIKYYNVAGVTKTVGNDAAMANRFNQLVLGSPRKDPGVVRLQDTYRSHPILTTKFASTNLDFDVVPVTRIQCRWIPGNQADARTQFMFPVPTRVHA